MLAHESETISYNSQIVVEFEGGIDPIFFKAIIKKAVEEIPWLRTKTRETLFNFKREIVDISEIDLTKTLEVRKSVLTQTDLDEFCSRKFNLAQGHSFTFLLAPIDENRTQLIFNVHHTLCDAAGQFLLLEEFFRLMNNQPVREEATKTKTFRYRNLFNIMGAKWFLNKLWENRKSLKKQRQYKMAGLIDHPENLGRTVSSVTFDLTAEQKKTLRDLSKHTQASLTEYLTFNAFTAYDLTLRERGDLKTPIMAYIPKTLRPYLKIRYSFQNILSTVLVVGKRDEIHQQKFLSKIKHIVQSHKMDQAGKFIFSTLLPCALVRPAKLKEFFKKIDTDPNSITSSMLISAGKVPRSFTFPDNFKHVRIWARGTMLKSPGVGIIYTGTNENETITIEFVKELTDAATIESLKKNLLIVLAGSEEKEVTNKGKIQLIPLVQEQAAPQENILQ